MDKDAMVTQSLPKELGVGPVDNRLSTNKDRGPKQVCTPISLLHWLYDNIDGSEKFYHAGAGAEAEARTGTEEGARVGAEAGAGAGAGAGARAIK